MTKFVKCVGSALLIGAIFILLINLPMRQVRDIASVRIAFEQGEYAYQESAIPLPVAAGWPETFYSRYDDVQAVDPFVAWSPSALLRNLGVGFGFFFALGCVEFLRRKAKGQSTSDGEDTEVLAESESTDRSPNRQRVGQKKVRYSLVDLILVTLLVALPLGYYQFQKRLHDADLKLSQSLGVDASVQREALMSRVLQDWIPSASLPASIRALMQRTTFVRLNDPDDAQVRLAISMPHLRGLLIGGGNYDLESLASLPHRHSLTVLHLTGRELDDATLSRIRLMDNLRSLNLNRTNVSHQAIERLYADRPAAAARLKSLNLVDSGVDLSGLNGSKALESMKSLEVLALPTPLPGSGAQFKVPPLPKLSHVMIDSRDRGRNASPLKIEIADCPELRTLDIGLMQKFSLNLARLPKLMEIKNLEFLTKLRLAPNQSAPGSCWLESIVIDDAPALADLKFYAADLREMRFTKTPGLKSLGPGVYQWIADSNWSSTQYDEKVPTKATAALVNGISQSDGPEIIDYSAVPLGDADLAPLMKNRRLKELYLAYCQLTLPSVRRLLGSQTLQTISMQGNDLGNLQIGELISQLPQLQRWHGDLFTIDRLRIENHEQIQGVVDCVPNEGTPRCHLLSCRALRLDNLPQWTDPIRLDADVLRYVTIQSLPKLQQLVINSPLCDKAVLSGLTGIGLIAVGGPEVDDELIADWSTYKNLSSIALHSTSISATAYEKLLKDRVMFRMDFRREKVNDKAILSSDPEYLHSVTLVGTDVTEASVRHVLKSPVLTEFNVSDVALPSDLIDPILKLESIYTLGIDASGWTAQQIASAATLPLLQHLTLKNARIDKSFAQALPENCGLTRLTLIDCKVDGPALATFMRKAPSLKLELTRTEIPSLFEGKFLEDARLVFDSEPENGPFARGPSGMAIAIIKRPRTIKQGLKPDDTTWGSMTMTMGMMGNMGLPNQQGFQGMSEDEFQRLSPIAFEIVDDELAIGEETQNDTRDDMESQEQQ
jgi:hypothetical protein